MQTKTQTFCRQFYIFAQLIIENDGKYKEKSVNKDGSDRES